MRVSLNDSKKCTGRSQLGQDAPPLHRRVKDLKPGPSTDSTYRTRQFPPRYNEVYFHGTLIPQLRTSVCSQCVAKLAHVRSINRDEDTFVRYGCTCPLEAGSGGCGEQAACSGCCVQNAYVSPKKGACSSPLEPASGGRR